MALLMGLGGNGEQALREEEGNNPKSSKVDDLGRRLKSKYYLASQNPYV